jgi:hypothetical protein
LDNGFLEDEDHTPNIAIDNGCISYQDRPLIERMNGDLNIKNSMIYQTDFTNASRLLSTNNPQNKRMLIED